MASWVMVKKPNTTHADEGKDRVLIFATANPAKADKITAPPSKVNVSGISSRNIQTQNGANITSDRDKSVSSAAGIVFEPIV